MPNIRKPRKGSMQYWPRKRSKRPYARIRSWSDKKADSGLLGFAGYKVGMTHLILSDTRKNSMTKGMDISKPATIIECPPLKIASVKLYKKKGAGIILAKEINTKVDKELKRKITLPKKTSEAELEKVNPKDYAQIRVLVYTQPKLTGRGNKKPELFEIGIAGKVEDQLAFAKEHLGKEIALTEVFKEGQQVDIHSVTKGKGTQGPVKRFGIALRQKKSEKVKRGPGSLGGWRSQAHVMYRVAHAGQTGYFPRVELNKRILKLSPNSGIAQKGGFHKYGVVKNSYVLIEGSIPGSRKRIIQFTHASRPNKKLNYEPLPIISIAAQEERKE